MTKIVEGKLTFIFSASWQALKYDETSFYRRHFQKLGDSRCVDIVAFDSGADTQLWLLEIKDYRINPRSKPEDLFLELARKVRDTLANLYLAERREEVDCYDFAQLASTKKNIRIVLHLEQSKYRSKFSQPILERDDAQIKLRQNKQIRVVDPHALICEISDMPPQSKWRVTSK